MLRRLNNRLRLTFEAAKTARRSVCRWRWLLVWLQLLPPPLPLLWWLQLPPQLLRLLCLLQLLLL